MSRLIRPVIYGVLIQAFALYLLFMMNFNEARSGVKGGWLLWNVTLAELLAGPMPQVGHGVDDGPIYEPTATHAAMGIVGLVLGVAVYSGLVYLGLRVFHVRRVRLVR